MFLQLAFSGQAFERLIKYRIADFFRPLTKPVNRNGVDKWLDGFLVTKIDFNRLENDAFVIVNHRSGDSIVPSPNQYGYPAGALIMDLTAEFYWALAADVTKAGLRQPPIQTEKVPVGVLRIIVRLSADANGVPVIRMDLDAERLKALGLPAELNGLLGSAASTSFPFDIGRYVGSMFAPDNDKVLNAGITRDDAGAIVMRFELPGKAWQSDLAHAADWVTFFGPNFTANLDADDWCMDIDGGAVADGLAIAMKSSFTSDGSLRFDSGDPGSEFDDGDTPRVVVKKHGHIENACAGNNVGFDLSVDLDLSVPSENLLRAGLSFDINKDDGDVARCIGVTLVNPFSVFITAVDNGQFGVGLGEIAASFVFPTKGVIATAAIGMLFVGVDKMVAAKIVADRLDDNPTITKLPDGAFSYDRRLDPRSELTRDWLVLRRCVGRNGRLLLTGDLRVPDAVLPLLTASDLEGMSKWALVDKCEPGKGQVSEGSIALGLAAGHGADMATGSVTGPTVSLKWGIQPNGSTLMYEAVNDQLGIYQDRGSEYQQVYVPGVPGVVETTLKGSTVRKPAFQSFGASPYPLRLRFFTSGGVREYQLAAPPPFKEFTETNADAFIRINNCKHRGANLILHKYLALKWLVDPSPELGENAQQWEVHVRGLEPGRKATVWNQDSGKSLVNVFADRTGRVDAALVLPNGERADSLLIALDDEPFLSAAQIRRDESRHERKGTADDGIPEVAVRQTLLTAVQHLDFDDAIDTLSLADAAGYSTLAVQTVNGRRYAHALPSPYSAGLATVAADAALDLTDTTTDRQSQIVWRGGHRQFMMLFRRPGRTDVLAEYSARSAYDLSASRHDLFTQVSSDGRRLTLYQKGAPLQLGSHEWFDDATSVKQYEARYPEAPGRVTT